MNEQEMRRHIDELIRKRLPYVEDGNSPETGFYCKTFFIYLYRLQGIELTDNLYAHEHEFRPLKPGEPRQFMDIVIYRDTDFTQRHVGMILKSNEMAQCSKATNGIAITNLSRLPGKISVGRHRSMDNATDTSCAV